ncbi:MAG: SIR2 family protein [Planctomycetes bacterium]|nr:SIR2 family protein [Planctomycetota bacterium]
MSGHVFIVRGDLRRIACDAWLIPCSRKARPGYEWFPDGYTGPRFGNPFADDGPRAQPLLPAEPGRPRPWLGWIGRGAMPVSWFTDGAVEFLEAAARAITEEGAPPLFGRARSLLALPVVGTGMGGGAARAGEIVQELLPRLEAFVSRTFPGGRRFDVALVCWDAASHAAAQAERVRRAPWPPDLTPELRREAETLAGYALRGELALFLGAGVSMAAGLPSWGGLLELLAAQAGMSREERTALADLRSALDQATVVERRLTEQRKEIGAAVAAVLGDRRHYALPHALLAALPVREAVTTNYDRLFDDAWALSDPSGLSVLPGAINPDARRWLLKMHGCLSDPARVVLTRSSYTRYDERLPALAGLVQAFLVTRHVLFVGFSLADDNFHRVVDAVRRLRAGAQRPAHFGTALALGHGGLAEVLWDRDIRRVRMDERERLSRADEAEAARRLEIFLDYLVSRTRDSAHLLVGARFDPLLTPGERALRDALAGFVEAITGPHAAAVRETVAWPQVERLLRGLGFEPPDE